MIINDEDEFRRLNEASGRLRQEQERWLSLALSLNPGEWKER